MIGILDTAMDNPFHKRATEYLRDDEAFLAVVSPEPVKHFLGAQGRSGVLYDRLVVIRGTPGSGKTTLARLFEYPTIAALLRNSSTNVFRELTATLVECGAIDGQYPSVVGCRLPLETDYREFWEFPYPEELKLGMMTALLQARAVLGWVRKLRSTGIDLDNISVIPRHDAVASIDAIGGTSAAGLIKRAAAVERSLYSVIGALVPPNVSSLDPDATKVYRPFDVVDRIRFVAGAENESEFVDLRPLVILDDAHALHAVQFRALHRWLSRRELLVARWMLTRLDVMYPYEALESLTEDRGVRSRLPGVTTARDVTEIMLQSEVTDRRENRAAFRKTARDMANRYLRQMPMFHGRGLTSLSDLLSTDVKPLSAHKLADLEARINATQGKLLISNARRATLLDDVENYDGKGEGLGGDVRLAMLHVLMHRYAKRTAQRTLFDDDPDPPKPIRADVSVFDAARIFLLHQYELPYFYGINDLCDASSENAEQFLHLAGAIVEAAMTRIIQAKRPSLDPAMQNHLLRDAATRIIRDWNFPNHPSVRRLVTILGQRCLDVSLEPNAWLGAGANAYGIPQAEFEHVPSQYPSLASVLQHGIAYNAFTLVPRYTCKGQQWCLLELGGAAVLHFGLTLKRGGFLEGSAGELAGIVRDVEA